MRYENPKMEIMELKLLDVIRTSDDKPFGGSDGGDGDVIDGGF